LLETQHSIRAVSIAQYSTTPLECIVKDLQHGAIVAVIHESQMLSEAAVGLDAITTQVRFYDQLLMSATVSLLHELFVRYPDGLIDANLGDVQYIGASHESLRKELASKFTIGTQQRAKNLGLLIVEYAVRSRRYTRTAVLLCGAESIAKYQTRLGDQTWYEDDLRRES
jgi:hypothetical protein